MVLPFSIIHKYSYLILLFFCTSLVAQTDTDSLEQKLLSASKDEKIKIYKELLVIHSNTDTERALNYAQKAIKLLGKKPTKDAGFIYLTLGRLHNAQSKPKKALIAYTKALVVATEMDYKLGIAKCYHNIAVTHVKMGKFDLGLEYYLKAIPLFETLDRNDLLAMVTGNVGSLYSCRLDDHDNGLSYFNKSLGYTNKTDKPNLRGLILTNMSEVFVRRKEHQKAEEALLEALQITDRKTRVHLVATILNKLSEVNIITKKYTEALAYTKRAISLKKETGNTINYSADYLKLARIYEHLNKDKGVAENYENALRIANEAKTLPELSNVYNNLHEYYNRKKEYKKGYDYLLKYNAIKDSLFSKENTKQLKEIQATFDLESKEKEVLLLTNENKIKALENKAHETTRLLLILGVIALLFIIATLYYGYSSKQKANIILEEKNNTISQTLKEREVLLKEIHHRVKNNLQIISSLLSLQHKFSDKKTAETILKESQDKIHAMSIIHEKLYKSNDLSLISLQTYLEELVLHFRTSYSLSEEQIILSSSGDPINLDMDHLVPCGLIINEIITNSIKHAFPDNKKGQIFIEAHSDKNECFLTLKDTGVGFPEEISLKNSSSLGMQLIYGLTRQINGSIETFSNPGASYTIKFTI